MKSRGPGEREVGGEREEGESEKRKERMREKKRQQWGMGGCKWKKREREQCVYVRESKREQQCAERKNEGEREQ